MTRSGSRAERLIDMERRYVQRGYTDIEMAATLGINRITVWKDRTDMETRMPFILVSPGRWKIDRRKYLSHVRLSLDEALVLYLAISKMGRHTMVADRDVSSAMDKIAGALQQPMTTSVAKRARRVMRQSRPSGRAGLMRKLVRAWSEGRKVEILYQSMRRKQPRAYRISPYLIEPAVWSEGSYLIGYSDTHREVRSFRIERIEQARLLRQSFEVPEDFDEDALFEHAWGNWYTDSEPVQVVLRFRPGPAARRVQESVWHHSQQIETDGKGGCVLRLKVASTFELRPFIRGWGEGCEVLEPDELREEIAGELQRAAANYNK